LGDDDVDVVGHDNPGPEVVAFAVTVLPGIYDQPSVFGLGEHAAPETGIQVVLELTSALVVLLTAGNSLDDIVGQAVGQVIGNGLDGGAGSEMGEIPSSIPTMGGHGGQWWEGVVFCQAGAWRSVLVVDKPGSARNPKLVMFRTLLGVRC
jgi:hypothetical protein